MKYYELDQEERGIVEAIEKGEFVSVPDQEKARQEAIAAARNTLNKTRNINIRLSERTLVKLKAKAVREGIPYQTLVASILHKEVN